MSRRCLTFAAIDKTRGQFLRYGLVGIATNAAGYAIYLLVTFLGVEPKVAASALYFVGATLSFFLNRSYTFSSRGRLLGTGGRYVVAHCGGYIINIALLAILVDRAGYPHQIVQALAIFVISAYLFTIFKLFVFPAHASNRPRT